MLVPPESRMEIPFSRASVNFADRASALSEEMNWGLIFPAPPWMTMAYAGFSWPRENWRLRMVIKAIRDVLIIHKLNLSFIGLQIEPVIQFDG
jgi:hypothetical protein